MYLLCHSVHSTETYRDTSTRHIRDRRAGDRLYRNDLNQAGEGHGPYFTDVSEEAGILGGIAGYGLGLAVGDLDGNGCPDIYIGNDFHENDFLYLNNCDGTFSEISAEALTHTSNFSMGNDLADVNNDSWLDIITLDMKPEEETLLKNSHGIDPYHIYRFKRSYGYSHQLPRNMLHLHRGRLPGRALRFSEAGQIAGMAATDWSWSALAADFDNDGWKDLHITNGIPRRPNDLDYLKFISSRQIQDQATDLELLSQMPPGKTSNYLFRNTGNGNFRNITFAWGLQRPSLSNGAAYADLDQDGDLDLIVNNMNAPAYIYENQASALSDNKFLIIKLKGPPGNRSGLGTKVKIVAAEQSFYQELQPVRGWQSSVGHQLHFGLGQTPVIDSLLVTWPDGKVEIKTKIKPNQANRVGLW